MSKTRCEAKNPATCRYHGTKLDESQWLPTYAEAQARLDDLNARTMSNHNSRSSSQALEAERQQAILDVDASHEGMAQLVEKTEDRTNRSRSIWAEEKIREALAHREHKLAAAAIQDFEGMKDEEYTFNTVERLFSGSTDAIAFEKDGVTVVSSVNENTGKVDFDEYDLTKADDRAKLVAKRREMEQQAASRALYNANDLRNEMLAADQGQIDIGNGYAVLRAKAVPFARVEFNTDGTFKRAITSGSQGYSAFLESSTAFRTYVAEVIDGSRSLNPIAAHLV